MSQIKVEDLYKILEIDGVRFEIRYGYISENEKERGWEPYPVYPDFLREPQYTDQGFSFVTGYQDVCKHYKPKGSKEEWCANCKWYEHKEESIGVCRCECNKKNE